MKNKLFRKHASVIPTGAPTLRSGQAARSGGIPSFRRFLATLGMTALLYWPASAQTGVIVEGLDVKPGTVTFNVRWNDNQPDGFLWSDSVWVFVDYNDHGMMKRLPLSGATLTALSWAGASVTLIPGNTSGAWVVGNARDAGAFFTTVKLFYTAQLDVAGACAYASNYPPVGAYQTPTEISFTGTPPYDIILVHTDGRRDTVQSSKNFYVPANYTAASFTDKTGAPGTFRCMEMPSESTVASYTVFTGTGEILFANNPATLTRLFENLEPIVAAATYSWSAPGFSPEVHTGATFSAVAPDVPGTYPVTLTIRSITGYCALHVTEDIVVACNSPVTQTLLASASTFSCAGTDAGVTFALSGTQSGATYQLYRDGTPVENAKLRGTGAAATFSGTFNVAGAYTARLLPGGRYCEGDMSGTPTVEGSATVSVPTVAAAMLCYGSPGQLRAVAPEGATVAWYNAASGGELLQSGSVLPLPPLYNSAAQYYAASMMNTNNGCVSARVLASYVVNNCVMGGDCPGNTAGSVGAAATTTSEACVSSYPGRIGRADYPAQCVSFGAGFIGRSQ
jgi:hypothetical protein